MRAQREAAAAVESDSPGSPGDAPGSDPKSESTAVPGWVKGWGSGAVALFLLLAKFKMIPLFLIGKLKLLLPFLLPILKTGGSMLVYIAVAASRYGWAFGVGITLSIFVHEMGHVVALRRFGHPFSAPLFIPGMGAVIFHKSGPRSVWESAVVGIAGPVAGTLAGLFCHAVFLATGSGLFGSLAMAGYILNLFNLAPIFPLDGGWITGAISPRLWLIGTVVLGGMALTGFIRNPLLILLLLLSLPRLIHGIRTGSPALPGDDMHREPATSAQKVRMSVAYLSLAALLAVLAAVLPHDS